MNCLRNNHGLFSGHFDAKSDGISHFPSDLPENSQLDTLFTNADSSFFHPFGARIGRGNSGSVFKAINLKDGRIYALKVCDLFFHVILNLYVFLSPLEFI